MVVHVDARERIEETSSFVMIVASSAAGNCSRAPPAASLFAILSLPISRSQSRSMFQADMCSAVEGARVSFVGPCETVTRQHKG